MENWKMPKKFDILARLRGSDDFWEQAKGELRAEGVDV